MSFAVFKIHSGNLYVRDFDLCKYGHELLDTLASHATNINDQDDLFCILGSAVTGMTNKATSDIVASIFVSQHAEVINNETELAAALSEVGINITFNRQGFWYPSNTSDDRVAFIQKTLQAARA